MDAVRFELVSPQIPLVMMEGRANGQGVRVLLDTGAAAPFTVLISPEAAARTAARPEETAAVAASGAGPGAVSIQAARLDRFMLGSMILRDVKAGISPALGVVGNQIGTRVDVIVGHGFVAGRTVSIDYNLHRVDFSARAGPPKKAIRFSLAPKRSLTLVNVTVNGRGPFVMALDTGASATLLSPQTAEAAGVHGQTAVTASGAGGAVAGGAQLGAADLGLGHYTHTSQRIAIADILRPISDAAGVELDGVLGADFLLGRRVTLDYKTNRLWISERSEKSS